jgi:hypothetical protein
MRTRTLFAFFLLSMALGGTPLWAEKGPYFVFTATSESGHKAPVTCSTAEELKMLIKIYTDGGYSCSIPRYISPK